MIFPQRLGVEINMHACSIALTQIENSPDHVDARTRFSMFNTLVVNLEPCQQYPI